MKNCDEEKELWPGGLLYAGESIETDALVLADFARRGGKAGGTACDLGCGCGILPLLLLHTGAAGRADGVEKRPEACGRARENLRRNGYGGRSEILCLDWCRREELRERRESYDLVLSNPPYFPAGQGPVSPDGDRAARRVESAPPEELCRTAAFLLKEKGRFCAVWRPERLCDLLCACRCAGLEPKRLRAVENAPSRTPALVLLECRKGASPGLAWEEPLRLRGDDGRETAEYLKICYPGKEETI